MNLNLTEEISLTQNDKERAVSTESLDHSYSLRPTCKQCGKVIVSSLLSLRDFCSRECKNEYRMAYKANWIKKKRRVDKRGSYVNTDSQNVDKITPGNKRNFTDQNERSETLNGYGGRKWYRIAAKYCCNFEVRDREAYCVTLFEPIQTVRKKCSDCDLGIALMNKYGKDEKKKRDLTTEIDAGSLFGRGIDDGRNIDSTRSC